ncbi:hypothetical protein HA402_001764 [Bradysia odoriphaga]|nr:hypothetical protein HA402_001764 [Bradysia odoriphaga]
MAESDIDLYADDLDPGFPLKDEFLDVDLYDDVIATPSSEPHERGLNTDTPNSQGDRPDSIDTNGSFAHMNNMGPNHIGRRHQLYVGNLTWWTTDQDITDACHDIGVSDFQDVKFFENRANGQSKGFCVISLASETSMRLCMERLPKKDLHGQSPVVTLPTKQALSQFESQQKTRAVPPTVNNNGPRPPGPIMSGPQSGFPPPPGPPNRMMGNPNGGPPQYRPPHMQGPPMQGPPVQQNQGPPRMQPPPMHQGMQGPMGPQQQGPPRYHNQNQWNGPPRPNGPIRPCPPSGPPQHRPMYQGGAPQGGMPRGPRPEWNRPPMHGGYQQGPPGPGPNHNHNQSGPHMQQPRGPPPGMMGGPGGPQGPAPHVNPAFFNQGGPPHGPPQHQGPPIGPPHGQAPMNSHQPTHFQPQNGPRWPGPVKPSGPPGFPEQVMAPQLSEVEFEEIMARNRTVSSSAIARAVSDAAAGEYTSAIETLVTAISLIKQSKVAQDERCKILISALQDTLHGIESKNYNSRRERSRSRERSHRRSRRERSTSRTYRERSRERERDRERDRDGGSSRHYSESTYRDTARETRDRSRSRERGAGGGGSGATDHYNREESTSSRSARPRKSPEAANEPTNETSKRSYYDERYRDRDRSDRDRDRDRDHRSRH